jgi:hypothetical protein
MKRKRQAFYKSFSHKCNWLIMELVGCHHWLQVRGLEVRGWELEVMGWGLEVRGGG